MHLGSAIQKVLETTTARPDRGTRCAFRGVVVRVSVLGTEVLGYVSVIASVYSPHAPDRHRGPRTHGDRARRRTACVRRRGAWSAWPRRGREWRGDSAPLCPGPRDRRGERSRAARCARRPRERLGAARSARAAQALLTPSAAQRRRRWSAVRRCVLRDRRKQPIGPRRRPLAGRVAGNAREGGAPRAAGALPRRGLRCIQLPHHARGCGGAPRIAGRPGAGGARSTRARERGQLGSPGSTRRAHRSDRARRRRDRGTPAGGGRRIRARAAPALGRAGCGHSRARGGPGHRRGVRIVRTVHELREVVRSARNVGAHIGLVPTMGAFHDGHLTLMRRGRERSGFVVVSLFVNPTQFNDAADLTRYPRDEARDAELAEIVDVDVLFTPGIAEVYPDGFATSVEVAGLAEPLEGAVRGQGIFARSPRSSPSSSTWRSLTTRT